MERNDAWAIAVTQADLPPFPLYRPATVEEAVTAFASAPKPAAIYAGGTDFFARLREGDKPASLIWIDRLGDLRKVARTADSLTLGARLTHHEIWQLPELDAVPGLAAAWRKIATVRIRRQATLGGNLMARRTRYEVSILLTALGATARFAGPDGETELPVDGIWDADLSRYPLLVSVTIPLHGAPVLDYERAMRPTFTQAACLSRTDGRRHLRVVIATEHLRPWSADAEGEAAAETLLDGLPAGYSDPAVSRSYLVQAGAAFLKRQIARMEALA